jgi:hypothetical protein
MKYAAKLALKPEASWYPAKQTRIVGSHVLEDEYGVIRSYVSRRVSNAILLQLPDEIVATCRGMNYTTIRPLKPHVHTEESCVINIYQTAGNAKTVFYEGSISQLDGVTRDNGNKYYLVDSEFLAESEEFVAQDGDVWLLNIRQPHAVIGKPDTRKLIQVFLDMPFEEARERLL